MYIYICTYIYMYIFIYIYIYMYMYISSSGISPENVRHLFEEGVQFNANTLQGKTNILV
jgi:hypothetical protein